MTWWQITVLAWGCLTGGFLSGWTIRVRMERAMMRNAVLGALTQLRGDKLWAEYWDEVGKGNFDQAAKLQDKITTWEGGHPRPVAPRSGFSVGDKP